MTGSPSRPRIHWILVLLALAAALFVVVASACGGDDDDDDGDGNEPTATESSGGAGGGGEETPTNGGDDDDAGDLAALTGDYEDFEGYVKYTASDFSADESLTSMAIYQKGDSSRIDIESSEGLVTIIETPDASYVCSENQCLKYPAGDTGGVGDLFTSFVDPDTIEGQFGAGDYDVSKEEIAGLEATCFSASNNEVCFAEGGLLLRVSVGDDTGGTGALEAVEADTDLPDDAFEPPFDVIDLSNLGQ